MRIWFNKTFSSMHCVLDLLKTENIDAIIVSHPSEDAKLFKKADERYVEPKGLVGEDYVEWCVSFCAEHAIDVFWPGKEADLIAQMKDRFMVSKTKVITVATPEVLDFLEHKDRFYDEMAEKGIYSAKYLPFIDKDSFLSAYQALRKEFEVLCIKPAVGVYAEKFAVIDENRDSYTLFMENVTFHVNYNDFVMGLSKKHQIPKMMVMEFLHGFEWSADCAAVNGQLLAMVQRKKIDDNTHYQVIDNHPVIFDVVERLAKDYALNGLFNAQFREGKQGVAILEINARPSGGTGKACSIGINLPAIYLDALMNDYDADAMKVIYQENRAALDRCAGLKVSDLAEPFVLID